MPSADHRLLESGDKRLLESSSDLLLEGSAVAWVFIDDEDGTHLLDEDGTPILDESSTREETFAWKLQTGDYWLWNSGGKLLVFDQAAPAAGGVIPVLMHSYRRRRV